MTSGKELSKSWADHVAYDFPPRQRTKGKNYDDSEVDSASKSSSDAETPESSDGELSDTMSMDEVQGISSGAFPKAPDRVYEIIKEYIVFYFVI